MFLARSAGERRCGHARPAAPRAAVGRCAMTGSTPGPGLECSALDAVRLRRLNRWQAEMLREDLADLYVESSDPTAGDGAWRLGFEGSPMSHSETGNEPENEQGREAW